MLNGEWPKIRILINNKRIRPPPIMTILIMHKNKVGRIMSKPTLWFHIVIKKGNTWYSLMPEK